jgi:glycosyltransferase involved in cell wall biosynthesis
MPLVSILIPTYNRSDLVLRAIHSAINQTIKDVEIIIVDNCSTDNTKSILDKIIDDNPKINLKAYYNDKNIGPVLNWKKCVELAQSPYSKILFSDDLISEDFLERSLSEIINPNCGLVYTSAIIGTSPWQGSISYQAFNSNCQIKKNCFLHLTTFSNSFCPVSPGAAFFRTSDLSNSIYTEISDINFDFKTTGAGVDWLIYPLIALKYDYVSYIKDPLSFFYAHSDSISTANEGGLVTSAYEIAKKWFSQFLKIGA